MRKKLSVGLVFAIVLMLIAVSVMAAALLSGKDFVQEVLRPKAQESQSESWTEEEVAEILRIAGENGLHLSEDQQAMLLEGGSYYKDELVKQFAKLGLGTHPSAWSIEDQAWFSQMLLDIGFTKETYATLPEEGEATENEVLAKVQAYVHQHNDPEAPLADETIYRRHTTYQWTPVNPDDEETLEKRWVVRYEPLSPSHASFSFVLDSEANIINARVTPGVATLPEPPEPDSLRGTYWQLYGEFYEWEMDAWVSFNQLLRESLAFHGTENIWGSELKLLSFSEFALPQAGALPKDSAISAAMSAVMEQEDVEESALRRNNAYAVYLLGEEVPVWKVTIPAAKEGDYITEINAQTGEARSTHFIPYGSSSIARRFMLESVYQAHHKESDLLPGTVRFDGRGSQRLTVTPLADGGLLLTGWIWVYGNVTDAWAARISANGETLWEIQNSDGVMFDVAVEMSDGSFLVAMEPKKGERNRVAVVSLDADGQMLRAPVILEGEGFAYEGKDCLLVRVYDSVSRTHTLQAVNGKGETLWKHTYDELKGTGYGIYPAADGYLLYGGAQDYPYDQSTSTGMMARLDDQGNLLWKKLMEEYPNTGIGCSLETADGGMFAAGSNLRAYADDAEPYETSDFVASFDAEGNVLWCHYYPQTEHKVLFFDELLPAPDGGMVVVAVLNGPDEIRDSLHFLHLDKEGTVQADWRQKIADFPIDFVGAVTSGGQSYLVYCDHPEFGPSNTYVSPFLWPES